MPQGPFYTGWYNCTAYAYYGGDPNAWTYAGSGQGAATSGPDGVYAQLNGLGAGAGNYQSSWSSYGGSLPTGATHTDTQLSVYWGADNAYVQMSYTIGGTGYGDPQSGTFHSMGESAISIGVRYDPFVYTNMSASSDPGKGDPGNNIYVDVIRVRYQYTLPDLAQFKMII